MSLSVQPQYLDVSYNIVSSLPEAFVQPSDGQQSLRQAESLPQQYNAMMPTGSTSSLHSRSPMVRYSEAEIQQHAVLLAQIQMAMSTSQQQPQFYLDEQHEQSYFGTESAVLKNSQNSEAHFDVGGPMTYGPTTL